MNLSKQIQKSEKRADSTYVFHDVGFHGDKHLIDIIDHIFSNEDIAERILERIDIVNKRKGRVE